MFQAVLQGKSLGYEKSEDLLTSTVFGAMRYIQPHKALIPFLESALKYGDNPLPFSDELRGIDVDLRNYGEVEYIYWPWHEFDGEPDLILIFKESAVKEQDLLLLIEVKFKSGKSGVGGNDQLARYARAVVDGITDFSHPSISGFQGIKGDIIYLTEADAKDEIKQSRKRITELGLEKTAKIFHLKWQLLYEILEQRRVLMTPLERQIADDLSEYLEKLGLRGFFGFSACEDSLYNAFLASVPIFYENTQEASNTTYFTQSPIVDFAKLVEEKVFYER